MPDKRMIQGGGAEGLRQGTLGVEGLREPKRLGAIRQDFLARRGSGFVICTTRPPAGGRDVQDFGNRLISCSFSHWSAYAVPQ